MEKLPITADNEKVTWYSVDQNDTICGARWYRTVPHDGTLPGAFGEEDEVVGLFPFVHAGKSG